MTCPGLVADSGPASQGNGPARGRGPAGRCRSCGGAGSRCSPPGWPRPFSPAGPACPIIPTPPPRRPPSRRDKDEYLDRRPQPRLSDLPDLVEGAREAGLKVRLIVSGSPVPLPAAVELAAYRVVQEGLTNALRYARSAPASVAVSYLDGELGLAVENGLPAYRDSQPPVRQREHGQDPRDADLHQARAAGPGARGDLRLRDRAGDAGRECRWPRLVSRHGHHPDSWFLARRLILG